MTEGLDENYESPRWTSEVLDCSMPMTLDTYSHCSYQCQYCFAFYQKVNCLKGLRDGSAKIRCVKPERIRRLFDYALGLKPTGTPGKGEAQFLPYISKRYVMQWGGLADPLDQYERKYGISLQLMRYFHSIDYPLSFSTKGAWWARDDRYRELMHAHKHNWHTKFSIITMDANKAKAIEKLVPTPAERLDAMHEIAQLGCEVTLRLRPYIVGMSEDWEQLIKASHEAGARGVSTEWFCMESRADVEVKERYKEMSRALGYDVWDFYMKNSKSPGYKRLSREIKIPVMREMRDYCHKLGMQFNVSDSHCREFNDSCNCCGVPPEWTSFQGHFNKAILIAKREGSVRFSDIATELYYVYGNFIWHLGEGYNSKDNLSRARYIRASMADYIRDRWNMPDSWSGMKQYGGILQPIGKDDNGDYIYGFKGTG